MKCTRCAKDCTYPERRATKKCPHCQGAFAYEPREGDWLSDAAFLASIDSVSGHGKLRWNYDHLYYEIARRKRPKRAARALVFVSLFAAAALLTRAAFVDGWYLWVPGGIAALITFFLAMSRLRSQRVNLSHKKFDAMFRKWCDAHGVPETMLPPPDTRTVVPTRELEADVADYSFDRAVVCDRPETAAFLIANRFHFENNCAILTIDGYPQGPFEVVRQMLKRNPELTVFVLHDASVAGCRVAARLLEDPAWFAEQPVRVVDVGLRPVHATHHFDGLMLKGNESVRDGLSGVRPDEAKWLASNRLELAAIRPEQVLKRLFGAIHRHILRQQDAAESAELTASGGDGGFMMFPIFIPLGGADPKNGGGGENVNNVIVDNDSFGPGDATTSDGGGGGDSFG